MSDLPFGFNSPSDDDDDRDPTTGGPGHDGPGDGGAANPFAALFGGDQGDFGAALQQIGQLLSYDGGPVNWDLAHDIARQTVAQGGDPTPSAAQRRAVEEAVRLAEVWLDGATSLPAGTSGAVAWSRAEWVEETLPSWRALVDPVAEKVVAATAGAVPAEMAAMAGPMLGMMRQLGGAMFGAQVGQGLGALAGEVVGSADVGLPIGPAGRAVLVPAGVARFGEGLSVPEDEVRLYLALRECAHQRLFAHVPWLRSRLFGAVEDYARGIVVDTSLLEEAMRTVDPSNPEALQEALQSGLFEPEDTPAQKAALARLETLLALVEGWVDSVVTAAAAPLPSADALRETVRRVRATGGPAEQTFATLVGLELRPRRLREAAALWAELLAAQGIDGRDAMWEHAELLPTAEDLDDPAGFVARSSFDLSELEDAGAPPVDPQQQPDEPESPPDGPTA
ncbi:MAG TPA: zinc-dependent metalloprotease [Actinomycetes bacterium]